LALHRLAHIEIGIPADALEATGGFYRDLGLAALTVGVDDNLLVQHGPFSILHHVAWEMEDVDAVGRAASEMLARDPSRHVWGLGRHAIGSNYFWYLRDPAGNFVEYTSDLDVIDEAEAWRVATSAVAPARLAVWGPPVPQQFVLPDDVAAMMAEQGS
jgi:hypothetical protein